MKVLIQIEGGMLSAVTADGEGVEVFLKDHDNGDDPSHPVDVEVLQSDDLQALILEGADPEDDAGMSLA